MIGVSVSVVSVVFERVSFLLPSSYSIYSILIINYLYIIKRNDSKNNTLYKIELKLKQLKRTPAEHPLTQGLPRRALQRYSVTVRNLDAYGGNAAAVIDCENKIWLARNLFVPLQSF